MGQSFPSVFLGYICILLACSGEKAQIATSDAGAPDAGIACLFAPTTTLAAETHNNTSTSDLYGTIDGGALTVTGNLAPSNISKVPISTLLYPGATTQVYAHVVPWFSVKLPSSHVNVGYTSSDPAEVKREIDDMISRGLAGIFIDWYGAGTEDIDLATRNLKKEIESRNVPFTFAIVEDVGALRGSGNQTSKTEEDLAYVKNNYFSSSHYLRGGADHRPVVLFFGFKYSAQVDYSQVRSTLLPENPLFVEWDAWASSNFDGSYLWVRPNASDPTNWGQSYLNDYYSSGFNGYNIGGAYKGFNDNLAAWGGHRVVNQDCGQTWLNTWAEINQAYSTSRQLPAVQLVTWNDYEEGTSLEDGIDDCLTIAASISGSVVSWNLGGNENTVDHYEIYLSNNGSDLLLAGKVATGLHQFDLSKQSLPKNSYSVYVKVVAKPFMLNHMSVEPLIYSAPSCP